MTRKLDVSRIYIMFFSVILAIVAKLIFDNVLPIFTSIPVILSFVISPVIALLISQKMIEKKFDGKEVGIFVVMMFISNFLMQLIPSLRELNLFLLQTTTTTGMIGTVTIYLLTIPLSVLVSDVITDKGMKLF
ncbi:MAG: hypothetical protein AABY22_33495 [Nanoarchaeota archaeon]